MDKVIGILYKYIDTIKKLESNINVFISKMQYQIELKETYKVFDEESFLKIKSIFEEFKEKVK